MKIFLWTLAVVVVGGGLLFAVKTMNREAPGEKIPGQYDTFAQCLKDSGAIFYGAFWCPHCQDQKKEFGNSEKLLPYVECSTPDMKEQTAICKEKGVMSYPTWIFKDDSRLSGKVEWSVLAEKTSCALPPGVATSTPVAQ
jgi:thiol-disulfide isomerase/thioredoxin